MTGHEVRVFTQQIPLGLELQFVNRHSDGGYSVMTFGHIGRVYVGPEDASNAPTSNDASLRLEPDQARALYEALAEHFGHTPHSIGKLRGDYDAERRRVDKLTDTVIQLATRDNVLVAGDVHAVPGVGRVAT